MRLTCNEEIGSSILSLGTNVRLIPQNPSMDMGVAVNHCINWFDSNVRSQSKGQVTERPKVAVLKTDVSKGTVGSNPTLPAKVLVVMFYGAWAGW